MKKSGKRGVGRHFASDFAPRVSSQIIKRAVEELCARLGLSEEQVLRLLSERGEAVHIPVSVFSNTKLSGLELVCKYLKDELGIHFRDIAKLLNRDYRTVWTTFAIAGRKHKGRLCVPRSRYFFPTHILADRRLSVLESIVAYLKDGLGLRFTEIASELHRDQRNVWTVYRRAARKLGKPGEKEGKDGENANA